MSDAAAAVARFGTGDAQQFTYLGCYNDGTGGRDLSGPRHTVASTPLTAAQECATHCSEYTYFGLQWMNECFCGNTYGGQGAAADAVASCGEVVDGVASLCANGAGSCGNLNAVYSHQREQYTYLGCYGNEGSARTGGHQEHVTYAGCAAQATSQGRTAFGMEYPQGEGTAGEAQCLLLDEQHLSMAVRPDGECEAERDSAGHALGSGWRLAVYSSTSSTSAGGGQLEHNVIYLCLWPLLPARASPLPLLAASPPLS